MKAAPSSFAPGALTGLKVLDMARFIAGPHCAMQLADLGADVVKIERKDLGDDTRSLQPHIEGESVYFMVFNRNKRSVTLNFRNPRAQEILRDLIAQADVLIENFRPGTMEKMGCGWDVLHELNPRLIMASISGYGQTGSMASEPCFDGIAQAGSGLMHMNGQPDGPPTQVGTFIVDYSTALYATIGIMAALEQRHRSGVGQLVDVSLMGSATSLLLTAIPEQMLLGQSTSRMGNHDRYTAPADAYQAKDGKWVYLMAGNDALFPRLVAMMGRPELLSDERFSTLKKRLANRAAADAEVAAWVAQHTSQEVLALARMAELPCAQVNNVGDVIERPYTQEAGHIVTVQHPKVGAFPMQGLPIRLSETPASVRSAAPMLGQHTEEVLQEWLGIARADVAQMRKDSVL